MDEVRIGVLGAAKAAPGVLFGPAKVVPQVRVAAIASRDVTGARKYASKYGIPVVHPSYEAVLADPEIDAVYIPLVPARHAEWTLRSLRAGKHVLCEKPLAANALEAGAVADEAARSGLVVMEGLHYRYHPLALKMAELLPELGHIQHVEASVCYPEPTFGGSAYQFELGGGATMEAGCYAIDCVRMLGPGAPAVVDARAWLHRPEVDRAMTADLTFPSGATGRMTCSLWSRRLLSLNARVIGSAAEMRVTNFMMPQAFHRLTIVHSGHKQRVRLPAAPAKRSTHAHQLDAFVSAILDGGPVLTPPQNAVANLTVIDAIYRAANLSPRGVTRTRVEGDV
jgi:predicted dehydrogenase